MLEVLVVGAGPVGLTLAAELARHGRRCRIVEALPAPLPFCRAIGVTPRTLEVWADMGVVRQAIDAGLWLAGVRVALPGQPPRDIPLDLAPIFAASGPTFGELLLPQYETERILGDHLARFGIAVERGVRLAEATQDAGGTTAQLEHADGRRETLGARYLVGCDGAHSRVRRAAGIAFEGEAYDAGFMLGDVAIAQDASRGWDLPRGYTLRAVRPVVDAVPEMFIAIPLPEPDRYRVSMLAPPELSQSDFAHGLQTERPGPTLAQLQAVADALVPGRPRLSDLRWSSTFRISMRLAARYRQGSVFLAGDAAHIHPPTGGQGMNTGIQDAYDLAWKLALVLEGTAPPALLDSYEAERRPVGAEVVARTRAASEALGQGKAVKPDHAADAQLFLSYAGAGWVRDEAGDALPADAPRAGERAPDCGGLRRDGVGFPLRLFELLQGTELVLLAPASQAAALAALDLRDLAPRAARRLRRVLVAEAGGAAEVPPGLVLLRDGDGGFARRYGRGCYLVRPDGYVAWRGLGCDAAGLIASLRTLLGGLKSAAGGEG